MVQKLLKYNFYVDMIKKVSFCIFFLFLFCGSYSYSQDCKKSKKGLVCDSKKIKVETDKNRTLKGKVRVAKRNDMKNPAITFMVLNLEKTFDKNLNYLYIFTENECHLLISKVFSQKRHQKKGKTIYIDRVGIRLDKNFMKDVKKTDELFLTNETGRIQIDISGILEDLRYFYTN